VANLPLPGLGDERQGLRRESRAGLYFCRKGRRRPLSGGRVATTRPPPWNPLDTDNLQVLLLRTLEQNSEVIDQTQNVLRHTFHSPTLDAPDRAPAPPAGVRSQRIGNYTGFTTSAAKSQTARRNSQETNGPDLTAPCCRKASVAAAAARSFTATRRTNRDSVLTTAPTGPGSGAALVARFEDASWQPSSPQTV